MLDLVRNLGGRVMGVLSGFDRLLFRGILRCVINPRGLNGYLYGAKVRMTDFDKHAQHITAQVIEQSLQHARDTGREVHYVNNSHVRKQPLALDIAARDLSDLLSAEAVAAVDAVLARARAAAQRA